MCGAHVILKNDGGAYLVHQPLILPSLLLAYPAFDDGLMGQDRGEPLVVVDNGRLGMAFAPAVDKLLHTGKVLRRLPVGLHGLANHDSLHFLPCQIGSEVIIELARGHCRQSVGDNLQRIGDSNAAAFPAVVYG